MHASEVHVFAEGSIQCWLDGGIHIKAVSKSYGDPVELSEVEALELASALQNLVAKSQEGVRA